MAWILNFHTPGHSSLLFRHIFILVILLFKLQFSWKMHKVFPFWFLKTILSFCLIQAKQARVSSNLYHHKPFEAFAQKHLDRNMPHGTVWYTSPQPWCAAFKQTCCVTRGVIFIISMSSNNFAIYLSCAKTSHEQYKQVGVPYPHKVFDNNCTRSTSKPAPADHW